MVCHNRFINDWQSSTSIIILVNIITPYLWNIYLLRENRRQKEVKKQQDKFQNKTLHALIKSAVLLLNVLIFPATYLIYLYFSYLFIYLYRVWKFNFSNFLLFGQKRTTEGATGPIFLYTYLSIYLYGHYLNGVPVTGIYYSNLCNR